MVCTTVATGQENNERPLSAIEWLQSADTASRIPDERAITATATSQDVSVTELKTNQIQNMGLIPVSALGFDDRLWDDITAQQLSSALAKLPQSPLPSMADLRQRLLLADVPAIDAIHQARLRGLLHFGSVEAAWAISKPIAHLSPQYFAVARDTAFLIDQSEAICEIWNNNKSLDQTPMTRGICLAQTGNWRAAVMVFFTHDTLQDLTDVDHTLISGYLDPELVDPTEGPNIPRDQVTPARAMLADSLGHPIPAQELPLAYQVADLRTSSGWKARLEAAERLLKAGSLTPNQLLGFYTEERAAASGGVWERVRAVQTMRDALNNDTVTEDHIAQLWAVMEPAGLINAAAIKFATALHELEAIPEDDPHLLQLGLLAGLGEVRLVALNTDIQLRLWRQDVTFGSRGARSAIAAALAVDADRIIPTAGDILDVLDLGARAREGDLSALKSAILSLRKMGMPTIAETLAIEYLILVDESA